MSTNNTETIGQSSSEAPLQPAPVKHYGCSYPKPDPCSKPDCAQVCTCPCDFSAFTGPQDCEIKRTSDSSIIFAYREGRVIVQGSETLYVQSWKQMQELGAVEECELFDLFADEETATAYSYFDFKNKMIKNRLKILLVPSNIKLTSVKSKNCVNIIGLSPFYNPSCHKLTFDAKVTGQAIQDFYIKSNKAYNYNIETPVINRLLPRQPVKVYLELPGNEETIVGNFTPANSSNIETITYSTEKRKLVDPDRQATVKISGDTHIYQFTLGYTAIVFGEFMLKETEDCDYPHRIVDIAQIAKIINFRRIYNITQDVVLTTPGKVTAEYYVTKPCSEEKLECFTLPVAKKAKGDQCILPYNKLGQQNFNLRTA